MKIPIAIVAAALLTNAVSPCHSTARENFHQGKTIRIVVGLSSGGSYDFYTRTIALHMGKQVPGKPGVTVENMPGAGSLIGANYIEILN